MWLLEALGDPHPTPASWSRGLTLSSLQRARGDPARVLAEQQVTWAGLAAPTQGVQAAPGAESLRNLRGPRQAWKEGSVGSPAHVGGPVNCL